MYFGQPSSTRTWRNQNKLLKQPSLFMALNYSGTLELILRHLSTFKSLTLSMKKMLSEGKDEQNLNPFTRSNLEPWAMVGKTESRGFLKQDETNDRGRRRGDWWKHPFSTTSSLTQTSRGFCWQSLRSDGLRLHNLLLWSVFRKHLGHLSLSCCLSATERSQSKTRYGREPAERKADSVSVAAAV